GGGLNPWVHGASIADDYRGLYRRGEKDLAEKYAAHVGEIVETVKKQGRRVTYLAETLPSVAGQIVFPPNYLAEVYRLVRTEGGGFLSPGVGVGLGRSRTPFLGF